MYMSAIGLCKISEDQKVDNEVIWNSILDDRLVRNGQTTINVFFRRVREMSGAPCRGSKRSWRGTLLSPGPEDQDSSASAQNNNTLNIPTSASVSCLTRTQHENSLSISTNGSGPLPLDQHPSAPTSSSLPINLSSLVPISKSSLLLQEVKSEPTPTLPAHLQLASLPRLLGTTKDSRTRADSGPEDLSVPKKKKPGLFLQWPGVDAIMESYQKYNNSKLHCDFVYFAKYFSNSNK